MSRVIPMFVPKQHRAIMKVLETDILEVGPAAQTVSDTNTINGAYHRIIGSGASETIAIEDFAKAAYALNLANVPAANRVAIVDPSVEFTLSTLTNLVNMSNNPSWEGVVPSMMSTGMKFSRSIYGFDVYVSQNLLSGLTDTIDGLTAAAGVANIFFSAAPEVLPFVFSMRQSPKVDSEYNKDLQRDEYVTTCRYGVKLFRPENLVTVITDNDQVYA